MTTPHEDFLLRIADTNLVAAQRLGELIGHAPEIEQDISLTNIGLDHLERARTLYQHLAELRGNGSTEDSFAFTRAAETFRNLCLAELPNRDFAHLILRQYLIDVWHLKLLARVSGSTYPLLSNHREAWFDQTRYHHRYTAAWVKRLGDGTEESHVRMWRALDFVWPYGREILESDAVETAVQREGIARVEGLGAEWLEEVSAHLTGVGLEPPNAESKPDPAMGKQGRHTPHLAELLTELQFMQHTFPDLCW